MDSFLFCLAVFENFSVQSVVLVGNDGGTNCVACDVNSCTGHIQNTVDTHDQADGFYGQANGIEYHCQSNQTYAGYAGSTDGCQGSCTDNGHIVGRS